MFAQVGKRVLKLFRLLHALNPEFQLQITKVMYTEVFRRANLYDVSQGLAYYDNSILKPVATLTRWEYPFVCVCVTHTHTRRDRNV